MKQILIVDDDPHIREVLYFSLEQAGFEVITANEGQQALRAIEHASTIDLIVMDINMPEMDGLECCREIRKTSDLPILFLSSRDDEIDRIIGLELGGDDYVTKPFSPRELVARVKAILKRSPLIPTPHAISDKTISYGLLVLDTEQHSVRWDDKEVALTATEFTMLIQFLKQPKRVFSRDVIMESAYDFNIHVSDRTIDSHIRHIRQKFADVGCDSVIDTQHSVGYKLSSCE